MSEKFFLVCGRWVAGEVAGVVAGEGGLYRHGIDLKQDYYRVAQESKLP